jgi:Domain of unknown function (DUF4389)/zinc-ribbon domain
MGFCPHCGAQVPVGAAFCPACGQPQGTPAAGGGGGGLSAYPASLAVDYPDGGLSRLSTFLRVFYAIPILIIIALVSSSSASFSGSSSGGSAIASGGGGVLYGPLVLMLLFRRKYPAWWIDWNLELTRFTNRVVAYLCLLDDRYPATDDEQAVHVRIDRPDAEALSRGLPLVKWLLAIPHYVVLFVLAIGAFVVVVIAWFAILFTGRYPRWAFDYVVGTLRWGLRVNCYAFLLTTDRYPPFSLND